MINMRVMDNSVYYSSREKLVRTQVINLNSYNRSSGTISDWTVDFASGLIEANRGQYDAIKIEPIQCVISRSWYTIDSPDNIFIVSINGTTKTYTIPPAFYNIKTWIQYLQTTLTFLTVGWNPLTNQLIFSCDATDTNSYAFTFTTWSCSLFGFDLNSTLTFNSITSLTSLHPVKMCLESVILVHSSIPLVANSIVGNLTHKYAAESSTILKIPLDRAVPFDLCVWRSQGKHILLYEVTENSISSVRFYLTDEFNRTLSPHFDWTISFRVEYYTYDLDPQIDIKNFLKSINDYMRYLVLHKMKRWSKDTKSRAIK